jgi:hypothetical protein
MKNNNQAQDVQVLGLETIWRNKAVKAINAHLDYLELVQKKLLSL